MKSVFTITVILLVAVLSGCASAPAPVQATFDHYHNGFVVGKTTCAEIVAKAGVPISQAQPLHDPKGEAITYNGKGKYGENALYVCSSDKANYRK